MIPISWSMYPGLPKFRASFYDIVWPSPSEWIVASSVAVTAFCLASLCDPGFRGFLYAHLHSRFYLWRRGGLSPTINSEYVEQSEPDNGRLTADSDASTAQTPFADFFPREDHGNATDDIPQPRLDANPGDMVDAQLGSDLVPSQDDNDQTTMQGIQDMRETLPQTPQARVIGTKKAQSLARREQRRAYHESLRFFSDVRRETLNQRLQESSHARELATSNRLLAESEIYEQVHYRQQAKRQELRQEKDDVDSVVRSLRLLASQNEVSASSWSWSQPCGSKPAVLAVSLRELVQRFVPSRDEQWMECIVQKSGILDSIGHERHVQNEGMEYSIKVLKSGWLVKVQRSALESLYAHMHSQYQHAAFIRGQCLIEIGELPALFQQSN